jgi:hypothetical protein
VVAASLFDFVAETAVTDEWIALHVVAETGTFLSAAVQFLAPAPSLTDRATTPAQALRKTVLTFTAGTGFALGIDRLLATEVMGAGRNSEVVLCMGDSNSFLSSSNRFR